MPTPTYRYLLCDLRTDQLLGVLPLTGVSFDRRISRVGALQATLVAPNAQAVKLAKLVHARAGRSALWVYRDGLLWWGGIVWSAIPRQTERGAVNLALQAATFDSYAHHRRLYDPKSYTQVDQGVIVPDLWRTIQGDPGTPGHIGVAAEDQPTGVLRDRTYKVAEHAYVGKLIEDLGDVIDGPEHTIDVYEDAAGVRRKVLRLSRHLGAHEPRVVFQRSVSGGGRVLEWQHTADAVDGGTVFQTRGDAPNGNVGEDVDPLLSEPVYRDDLLAAGWPLLDVTADHPGVIDPDTLDGHAQALAATNGGAMATSSYIVDVGDTGWSPNRIGDAVRIKLRDDWHTSTEDVTVRPVGCQVQAAEGSTAERVTLLLDDEEG